MQGYSGSYIKYIMALSPAGSRNGASAETGASNFAGYEFATLIATMGSPNNAAGGGWVTCAVRSGTSNGTFSAFGASLPGMSTGNRQTSIRSFSLDSSATWYKIGYDNSGGAGGAVVAIVVALSKPRSAPVPTQDTHVTIYSDVLGG